MKILKEDMNGGGSPAKHREEDREKDGEQDREKRKSSAGEATPTDSTPSRGRQRKQVRIQEGRNGELSPAELGPAVTEAIPRSPRLDGAGRRKKLVLHVDQRKNNRPQPA